MSSIDEELEDLYRRCPILDDEGFLERFPAAPDFASFMDGASKTFARQDKKYPPFEKVGVDTTQEYIQLLSYGHEQVVNTYNRVVDILELD
tara:strand:+ start:2649 stop:2921 length:273 start_codon:yes stop_codon:yes gene_type:complete